MHDNVSRETLYVILFILLNEINSICLKINHDILIKKF